MLVFGFKFFQYNHHPLPCSIVAAKIKATDKATDKREAVVLEYSGLSEKKKYMTCSIEKNKICKMI